jgi:HNH endonuclease/NUMOD4 motif/NUMOD1 domain
MSSIQDETKMNIGIHTSIHIDINELIKKEIWRTIPGFSIYEISSFGKVRNIETKQITGTYIHQQYLMVSLYNGSRSVPCKLHRLLALTFLQNPEKYACIDHVNADKLDNALTNLRWCTYSDNTKNWHKNRTNYKKVIQYISKDKEIVWNSANEAANELELKANGISKCCNPNNDIKIYMGFNWQYADPAHRIPKENIDYNDYTCIGEINDLDFSDFWIKNDGTKIVNKENNNGHAYEVSSGYKRVKLVSNTKVKKNLLIHKIINQIFLNGKYDDTVAHLDGNKLNNDFTNLKVMFFQEATAKATGILVYQLDKDTNEIMATFNSMRKAARHLGTKDSYGISKVCDGKQITAHGYKWEKA